MPDINSRANVEAGFWKRNAASVPEINRGWLAGLGRFVKRFIRRNLRPVDRVMEFEEWAISSNLPAWRIEQYRQARERMWGRCRSKHLRTQTFIKQEFYPSYKYPRLINPRKKAWVACVAPAIRSVEKEVYEQLSRYFIKLVPVDERPSLINKLSDNGVHVDATDLEHFECSIQREIQQTVELPLYEYMLKPSVGGTQALQYILMAKNARKVHVVSAAGVGVVSNIRCSADPDTSLSNGWINLCLYLYFCKRHGIPPERVRGYVEGDDGIFCIPRPGPTKLDYEKLGFRVKLNGSSDVQTAGFCGNVFSRHFNQLCDPAEALVRFGWCLNRQRMGKKKRLEYLRWKGMSYAYLYSGAPILRSLAKYALRVTKGSKMWKPNDWWDKRISDWAQIKSDQVWARLATPITWEDRLTVSEKFGVSPSAQIEIETYLDGLEIIRPLTCGAIIALMNRTWLLHWHRYVRPSPT